MTTWTYWEGPRSPAIDVCLETISRHHVDLQVTGPEEIAALGGGEVLRLTDGRDPRVRSDLVRLWLLKNFGGQWIDADTVSLQRLDLDTGLRDADLVGFGSDSPIFSNCALAANAGTAPINIAYDVAVRTLRDNREATALHWGQIGQGLLAPLWDLFRFSNAVERRPRWKYAALRWDAKKRWVHRGGDEVQSRVPWWNPRAVCYHVTAKGLAPFSSQTRERILRSQTFLGFVVRKALGLVKPLRSREILARLPKSPCVGVEVGVFRGRNAAVLLQQRHDLTMHLVDLWSPHPIEGTYRKSLDAHAFRSASDWESVYADCRKRLAWARDRVIFRRGDSVAAANDFSDRAVDFVFIDGDHSELGVARDIAAWASKIRSGGWIGGHDYDHPKLLWGVSAAVDRFVSRHQLRLQTGDDMTWFVNLP